MTSADDATAEPGPEAGIDEIRADIEETRNQLGETVSELGAKYDVKGRAEAKVDDVKASVAAGAHSVAENARAKPAVPAIAVAGVIALVATAVVVRRRRSR